ncbi:phosphotransferase [Nesterenkonia sp. Act20]|uniref:phosphotransferase n=1 Tax=Nesterenkonia sp. Act20 TaxID=1483432 RepID=UPI001C450A95|nr:phosphotransferase [Nesterenkonia sp. Act20]
MDQLAALVSVLRGPTAGELLRMALEPGDVTLSAWKLEQVYARPGAETTALYQVETPGMPLTLVISTVSLTDQQRQAMGAVRAESVQGTVHIWAHPVDPELPGLLVVEAGAEVGAGAEVCAGAEHRGSGTLEERLSRLLGEKCSITDLRRLVLRPLRRAVYRAVVSSVRGERVLYLKVVRPAKVPGLLQRHRCSRLSPPAADAGEGILVIPEAPGMPLTHHLYRPTPSTARGGQAHHHEPVPRVHPKTITSALDSLTPSALELPARESPAQRHRGLEPGAIGAGADPQRVGKLGDDIAAKLSTTPGPVVPTHGDFHPANLFLDQTASTPTALIDADTVGPGYRVDDLATMLGHLITLPSFNPAAYSAVPDLARRFFSHCLIDHDPDELRARTAAVLLSLLPGVESGEQREHYLHWAEQLVRDLSPADLLR